MNIKLIISVLFILGSIAAAIWQKVIPASSPLPSVYKVQMKNGGTLEVEDIDFDPLLEDNSSSSTVTLHNDIGYFFIRKDLEDVKSIQVLDNDAALLRVTYQSDEVLEGKRQYRKSPGDDPRNPLDRIRGNSGKLRVSISMKNVVSITREEGDDE